MFVCSVSGDFVFWFPDIGFLCCAVDLSHELGHPAYVKSYSLEMVDGLNNLMALVPGLSHVSLGLQDELVDVCYPVCLSRMWECSVLEHGCHGVCFLKFEIDIFMLQKIIQKNIYNTTKYAMHEMHLKSQVKY